MHSMRLRGRKYLRTIGIRLRVELMTSLQNCTHFLDCKYIFIFLRIHDDSTVHAYLTAHDDSIENPPCAILVDGEFKDEVQHDLKRCEHLMVRLESNSFFAPVIQSIFDHSQYLLCDCVHAALPTAMRVSEGEFEYPSLYQPA